VTAIEKELTSTVPTLTVEGLRIAYRSRGRLLNVVSDLSLQIAPGQAYGLVGESGCGKSTVAMALMRYLPSNGVVEAGKVSFGGDDLLGASQGTLRKWRGNRIAMVYQDPGSALNPTLRVGTQISEIYRYHQGMHHEAATAASVEMLAKVNFADPASILRRYPHELSGGQQQRVMIAMALASSPELLIMDEPTTGLDATVEAEVLDLVEQLRSELNSAILFISHNLGIVARLCETVGVLYAGRMVEEGPAQQVFDEPRHPYTMSLLRCVPRPGMRKDVKRLDPIPGFLPGLGEVVSGCSFAERCPNHQSACDAGEPALIDVGPSRRSRCLYPERVHDMPTTSPPNAAAVAFGADGPVIDLVDPLDTLELLHAGERVDLVDPLSTLADPGAGVAGSPRPVLLEVRDLVKRYRSGDGEVTAVAGVSFDIREGEIFGLVGESGSGKSTLARMLAGLNKPTEGTISYKVKDAKAVSFGVQMVFQNPDTALNPRHTVRRILNRSLKLLASGIKGEARQNRLNNLIGSVRVQPRHLDLRPAALSGGLKQRVAIARAFAGTPLMVLCDEPVSALDVSVQAAILNLLVDLQAESSVSYLFISHDLAVVRYLSDRIGVLYLGQLVDLGPAEAVWSAPHHPYTEALLSAIPSVDREHRGERIRLTGTMPSPANPPTGCRFHTRCPRVLGPICSEQEPAWQQGPNGNQYRCHIEPVELLRLQSEA
jgi:peptide/nickel transport system ATP-binding protein